MVRADDHGAARAFDGAAGDVPVSARILVLSGCRAAQVVAILSEIGVPDDRVSSVRTLAEARAALVAEPPGAIVVDLDVGVPAGLEAVAVLAAAEPEVPMVVLVPDGLPAETGFQALSAGADDLVVDGLDLASFSSALRRATRRHEPGAQGGHSELAAVLDCIDDRACLVDGSGRILATNQAWRAEAEAAGADPESVGPGVNYLTVCERAAGEHSEWAAEAAAGIRSVLFGETARFILDYPCPSGGEDRWFALRVSPFGERGGGALVVHRDITALKLAEHRVRLGAEWVHRMLDEDYPVFALVNAEGVITHVSPSTLALLGRSDSTVGKTAFFSVDKRQRKSAIDAFRRVIETPGATEHVLVHVLDGHGRVRELDLEVRNRLDDPLIAAVSVVGSDVTEARRHQIARRLESRLLQRLPAAVCVTDERDAVVYWNAEAARLFGHAAEEMAGRDIGDVGVWPPDLFSVEDGLVLPSQRWEHEYDARRADGTSVPVRTMLERVDDDEIDFHGVVGASVDISERRELEQDLAYRALHDALTGLPNRALFLEHLQRALARDSRSGRQTAVLFADLDDFKSVNDRHGHSHGDAVLQSAAQRIAGVVRAGDVVARLGGDEFAICCEDLADRTEAFTVAQRIVDALGDSASDGADALTPVSVSIGVATAGPEAQPETLLRHADVAMYDAKERGKARVEMFDEELHHRSRQRKEIAVDLEGALAQGGIDVVYQPEYVLDTGELFGFEALARWTHPEWGPVAPGDFIRVAEMSGTIGDLGAQVLAIACDTLSAWGGHAATPVRMTVNVSSLQLVDPSFPELVRRTLASSGLPPKLLCLEITESALADAEPAARALEQLKAIGVETSIDDFGTEYSSLSRLQRFPIDYLKIDRGFVSGMTYRAVDAAIIEALLGLARSLGIRTVAKGVEDHVQLASLRGAGCDLGQGFFWSKPVPAADAAELVAQARRTATRSA
jgi:diguanylate cyclase (GGDEF)-like protein/PAS domain S-box-containing protein